MKKYFILALCAVLSFGLITGCGSKRNEKKDNEENTKIDDEEIIGSNQIESCPNCVYSFYNHSKSLSYGKKPDVLTDYTTDYTSIIFKGEQRKNFLGHILDEEGRIMRGFACGIENGTPFCVEGTTDGSTFEANMEVMKSVYGEENCKYEDTKFGYSSYVCNGDVFTVVQSNGISYVRDKTSCAVNNTGYMFVDVDFY